MPQRIAPKGLTEHQRAEYLIGRRLDVLARRGLRRQVVRTIKAMVLRPGLSDDEAGRLLAWLKRNEKLAGRGN